MRTRIKNKRMKRQLYEWHVAMLRLYGVGDKIKSYRKWLREVNNTNKLSPTSKVKYLDTLLIHEAFEVARKHMNPEEAVEYIIKRHEQEKS